MYLDFFNLREAPFQLTPDSDFLFMSEAHARAMAYMKYTICNRDGFVVVTGEIGAGKTTLIQKLLSEFEDGVLVAKIFQTQLDETQFLQAVLVEFGLNPFGATKVELMDMLSTFLVESFIEGKQLVLIVDEAQNLSPRVLEEIRMLSGLETQKEKVLHVVLVGQPTLNDLLDSPALEQLLQRVRLRCHISALSDVETAQYINHRLSVAGADDRALFAGDTLPSIFRYTGGIPRLVNTLCDMALVCAFSEEAIAVTSGILHTAIKELQWIPYAERINKRDRANKLNQDPLARHHAEAIDPRLATLSDKVDALGEILPTLQEISQKISRLELSLQRIAHRDSIPATGTMKRHGLTKEQK